MGRTMTCDEFCQKDLCEPWESPWEDDHRPSSRELMLPLSPPHRCTRLHIPRKSLDFQYSTTPATYAEPSPHHVLVLQTAARPHPTLENTLSSLLDAGFDQWPGTRILSSDGIIIHNRLAECMTWHAFESPRSVGAARAFVRDLRLGLAVDPDLELLTFVEDDVELCRNALAYVARVRVPADVALVTWFTYDYDWTSPPHLKVRPTPEMLAHDEHRGVLACRPARFFILTQTITLPRRTVDLLLSCPRVTRDWPRQDGHDEMISWVLGDALYAAHFPVLVQHQGGLNSAVVMARKEAPANDAQAGARESPHYVGRDFDALSLLPRTDE